MNKILNFIKSKYKILIPIILLIILLLVFIIYKMEYKNNKYKNNLTDKYYVYILDNKYEFDMKVSTNRKKEILNLEPIDININLDSTPIYSNNKVIFPEEVSIIFPTKDGIQYKINKYLQIEKKNNLYYLITNNYNKETDYFFIYDGKDMYFFYDEVTIYVNNEEIKLSPMSYLYARNDNSLEYYDYETDTYKIIENINTRTIVKNSYMEIDVKNDFMTLFSNQLILSNDLDSLDLLKEK